MTTYSIAAHDAPNSVVESRHAPDQATARRIAASLSREYPAALIVTTPNQEPATVTDPTTITTTDHGEPPLVIAPEPQRKSRQRIARVQIPPEIHALAELTGTKPDDLIADMLAAQVSAIRSRAKSLTSTAGI